MGEPLEHAVSVKKINEVDFFLVGESLRNAREARNWERAFVAPRLCLSLGQIEAMETGVTKPFPSASAHIWSLRRYAHLLEIEIEPLLCNQSVEHENQPFNASASPQVKNNYKLPQGVRFLTGNSIARNAIISVIVVMGCFLFIGINHKGDDAIADGRNISKLDITGDFRYPIALPNLVTDTDNEKQIDYVEVEGLDAAISGNYIFVQTTAPVVISKKLNRKLSGEEHLSFPNGLAERIAISDDNFLLINTERSDKVDVFFQKRKVPAEIISMKRWIKFKRRS